MNKHQLSQTIMQYPTELVFASSKVAVDHLLTVLDQRCVVFGEWSFQFAIIGESHFVTIRHRDEFVMQEVLACTDIPAILQADSHKFDKLETYTQEKQNYRARVWFSEEGESIVFDNWSGQFNLIFPETFGQIPETQVVWICDERRIEWRTMHVYPQPETTTYVYTESQFDLNGEV